MKSFLLISFFCFCNVQKTWAKAEPGAPPVYTLSFKTLALSNDDYSGIYVQSKPEEEPVLLSFNRYRRSKPIEYEGTSPMVFFRIEKTGIPETPFRKVPVASFKLPFDRTPKDLLLIFRPNKQEKATAPKFSTFGMDDSPEAFPTNTVIFFNATSITFVGIVNKEKSAFPPGPSKTFPMEDSLYVAIALHAEDSTRVLFENTFKFQEDRRVLIMLHPPKREGSLRIQCYYVTENMAKPQQSVEESKEE